MNLVVEYVDTEGKSRWGHVTSEGVKIFDEYLKKAKQQEEEGEGNNEILDINVQQLSKIKIKVYLPDGTIGNPELRHLTIALPFVQYSLKKPDVQSLKTDSDVDTGSVEDNNPSEDDAEIT